MVRLRAAKYLACFYCGRRSALRSDDAVRDFQCLHCDATNYLDQNGEITDPPVATEREAAVSVQYAAPQPDASPRQDDIFCQRCLKNQHLFTKSLAQYLPDDPADPDYPELERNYYRYRRNLEARYPQVCGDCADKVEERIRQAGYTAKTDHLRRMMNLTRRRKTRTRSKLDWVDTLGRFLWRMGFATQALWHCQAVAQALQETESGIRDPDAGRSTLAAAASALQLGADVLPSSETAITWSLRLAFLAAWWNPHFVQVNRGFARHLLGFTQWYSIQGLIIFFRFIFRSLDTSPHTAASPTARLGRHVAMAAVTLMTYSLAGRCIRVDMTPLFATPDKSLVSSEARPSTTQRKQEDAKTFSELVNDALDSTNATPRHKTVGAGFSPSPQTPFQDTSRAAMSSRRQPLQSAFGLAGDIQAQPQQQQHQQQQVHYDQEMDWSPMTPQRHLLKHEPSSPAPSTFGQPKNGSETENPFWFKVPAAPADPARRLRNPIWSAQTAPNQQPRQQQQHDPRKDTGQAMFSRRGHEAARSRTDAVASGSTSLTRSGVEFKPPSFFAPQKDQDASSLADLLSSSFSLDPDPDSDSELEPEQKRPSPNSRSARTTGTTLPNTRTTARNHPHKGTRVRVVGAQTVFLGLALLMWLVSMFARTSHRAEMQLAALCVAGVAALRGTAHHSPSPTSARAPARGAYLLSLFSPVLSAAALAALCWIARDVWYREREQQQQQHGTTTVDWRGAAAVTAVLGHDLARNLFAGRLAS